LNFALVALFLLSTVSMTKLKLTKQDIKPVTVTFRGYVKFVGTNSLVPDTLLPSAKITFTDDNKNQFTAKIVGDGTYEVTLPIGRYVRTFSSPGFYSVSTSVCIRSSANGNDPKHTIDVKEIPRPLPPIVIPVQPPNPTFTIRGLIKDSTTNNVINNTSVSLVFTNKATKDKFTAKILAEGIYEVTDLTEGSYTVDASLKGYAEQSESRSLTGPSTETDLRNVIFLSPELNGWRFVLTWGATPLDLDSHMILPDTTEVNFDNRKSGDKKVKLDIDALKGFGPETITMLEPSPGIYTYYVNRYSNEAPIQKSGARVVVYHGKKKVQEFAVPTGGDETLPNWVVATIDTANDTMQIVNQLNP